MNKFRKIVFAAAAAACALSAANLAALSTAQAQTWPQRNVKFILPFGAGSATDIAARLIGEKLAAKWGQSVVIENRPGGDGLVAINAFITANDDHVLLYASSASFLAHPYTQEKMPYDLERDLAPIARVTDTVLAVSVPGSSGYKTIGEFVQAAKAAPEKFNAAGAAGVPEFTVDAFIKSENLKIQKVPYKDIVQGARDLAEDRIQFMLSSVAILTALVDAGKIRLLAVAGRERSPLFKDVPSVVEAGYPGLVVETTAALYGPKTMALDVRKRISADVIAAVGDPEVTKKILSTGQDIVTSGPEELAATLKRQTANTAAVAKVLGMEAKK
ncbi:MAG TPA: tripartite tricarboxylate transporter substrate binding protein, partial [Xanthobacteraceae bacterium]|jgi:tripartite-type tricarboxylate transporter receptor subunit TctC|nr:tripartite tricarboxylate transporter substrate binding protein [Xanthobacteraceae bacterium]